MSMKLFNNIMFAVYYLLMVVWLGTVCFESKGDHGAKGVDMLYAIWASIMMRYHKDELWRQS